MIRTSTGAHLRRALAEQLWRPLPQLEGAASHATSRYAIPSITAATYWFLPSVRTNRPSARQYPVGGGHPCASPSSSCFRYARSTSAVDVCRRLRGDRRTVPIVMLTVKDAELDRVLGLELGADDYVTKPFSQAELLSRIRALFRRRDYERESTQVIREIGGLRLDFARHEVLVVGKQVRLTASEFKVLTLLASEPERVFSRRQVMEHLWQSSFVGDEHAADVHISNLRRKIERDSACPERIVTVRSFGYKLVPA